MASTMKGSPDMILLVWQ